MANFSGNDESPVNSALQNELILQEIFNFFPLKSLLTLSEVNKFWNARVRTYIRDHRKCTVSISSSTLLPCTQLEQLDQDLAGMTVIPFNSLKIKLGPHTEPGPNSKRLPPALRSCHEQNLPLKLNNTSYDNLISKLKLKYLCISWDDAVVTCPVTFLICRLLSKAGAKLKSLSFKQISPLYMIRFSAYDRLEFPRLEELQIWNVFEWMKFDNDHNHENRFLQKILDGAPKLEKIIHGGRDNILEILPESKYNLVSVLVVDSFEDSQELIDMQRRLIRSGPRISQLTVNCLPLFDRVPVRWGQSYHAGNSIPTTIFLLTWS